MPTLRRLIALLLMLTLPAYAWAALGLSELCPMQSSATMAPMAEMLDTDHACCDEAEGDHGQPDKPHTCKPGQECKAGSLYQPGLPRLPHALPPSDAVVATAESTVLSRDPTGVWRPPRSH